MSFSRTGTHGVSRRGSGEEAREALTLTQGLQIFPGSIAPPTPGSSNPAPLFSSSFRLPASSRGFRNQDQFGQGWVPAAREERLVLLQPQAPLFTSRILGSSKCPGQLSGSPTHLCTQKSCRLKAHRRSRTLMSLLTSGSTSSRTGSLSSPASLVGSECQGYLSRSVGMGDAKKNEGAQS